MGFFYEIILERNMNKYDFQQATILGSLKILPADTSGERQIIISLGIEGKPSIKRSLTLKQLRCLIINDMVLTLRDNLDTEF